MRMLLVRRADGGFGYVATVILLVVMAGMGVAAVRLNTSQAATANATALTSRAGQAARGGLEWMFYQVRTNGKNSCINPANPTVVPPAPLAATLGDFQADTGFKVTVGCSYVAYNEGQDPSDGSVVVKHLYRIQAVACNGGAGSCPDNGHATQGDYVERSRVATICITSTGNECY